MARGVADVLGDVPGRLSVIMAARRHCTGQHSQEVPAPEQGFRPTFDVA
jgi:hypothetical protein